MDLNRTIGLLVIAIVLSGTALAQETIFNVPSGDILGKGKVYGEFDFSYLAGTSTARATRHVQ